MAGCFTPRPPTPSRHFPSLSVDVIAASRPAEIGGCERLSILSSSSRGLQLSGFPPGMPLFPSPTGPWACRLSLLSLSYPASACRMQCATMQQSLRVPRAARLGSSSSSASAAASSGSSARGLGAAKALPPLRRRRQQEVAVCSLTSYPGEVSTAGGRGGGRVDCRRIRGRGSLQAAQLRCSGPSCHSTKLHTPMRCSPGRAASNSWHIDDGGARRRQPAAAAANTTPRPLLCRSTLALARARATCLPP